MHRSAASSAQSRADIPAASRAARSTARAHRGVGAAASSARIVAPSRLLRVAIRKRAPGAHQSGRASKRSAKPSSRTAVMGCRSRASASSVAARRWWASRSRSSAGAVSWSAAATSPSTSSTIAAWVPSERPASATTATALRQGSKSSMRAITRAAQVMAVVGFRERPLAGQRVEQRRTGEWARVVRNTGHHRLEITRAVGLRDVAERDLHHRPRDVR